MSFKDTLASHAALVECRLEALLTALPNLAHPPPQRLAEAMRYAALGGGKRIRPFLLMESAGLFGVAP